MADKERDSFDSTSTSSSILERLVARDVDTNWQSIHRHIVNYRKEKKITIKRFLTLCELSPNRSYFQQLCSAHGNEMHPSNKPKSPGQTFLDAVNKFFENEDNVNLTFPTERKIDENICDFELDNDIYMLELGITGLRFDIDEGKVIVSCVSSVNEERALSCLKVNCDLDNTPVEFRKIELLYLPPPYTSISPIEGH